MAKEKNPLNLPSECDWTVPSNLPY